MNVSREKFRQTGFTLLEVLVAVGVASSLLLVLLLALRSSSENAASMQGHLSAAEEARVGVSILERDLAHAVNLAEFFYQDGSQQGPLSSDAIGFFTHIPQDQQGGDQDEPALGTLCYVYYYTAVTPELPGEAGPLAGKLYRQVLPNNELVQVLQGGGRPEDQLNPQPEVDDPVAFNVVRFRSVPWEMRGNQPTIWQRPVAPANGNNPPPATAPPRGPSWLELEMIFAGERLASTLSQPENWDDAQRLGDIDQENLRGGLYRFITRVRLDRTQPTP